MNIFRPADSNAKLGVGMVNKVDGAARPRLKNDQQ